MLFAFLRELTDRTQSPELRALLNSVVEELGHSIGDSEMVQQRRDRGRGQPQGASVQKDRQQNVKVGDSARGRVKVNDLSGAGGDRLRHILQVIDTKDAERASLVCEKLDEHSQSGLLHLGQSLIAAGGTDNEQKDLLLRLLGIGVGEEKQAHSNTEVITRAAEVLSWLSPETKLKLHAAKASNEALAALHPLGEDRVRKLLDEMAQDLEFLEQLVAAKHGRIQKGFSWIGRMFQNLRGTPASTDQVEAARASNLAAWAAVEAQRNAS